MTLDYLDFDFSDEDTGWGSFDAMAAVAPDRLPALLHEIGAVLSWATAAFGPAAGFDEGGEWDCELQGTDASGGVLELTWHAPDGDGAPPPARVSVPDGTHRTTLTLTLSGSPAFCEAFAEHFEVLT